MIVNLASKEYSKAVEPFLAHKNQMIHVVFGSLDENSKVRQKATEAKMARGEMIRYLAEIQAEKAEDLKGFTRLGYQFHPELSDENHYAFIK